VCERPWRYRKPAITYGGKKGRYGTAGGILRSHSLAMRRVHRAVPTGQADTNSIRQPLEPLRGTSPLATVVQGVSEAGQRPIAIAPECVAVVNQAFTVRLEVLLKPFLTPD
jgi:hypothetical protein